VDEADRIRTRFEKLTPFLDERMRRLVAASESLAIGFGGTSEVPRQTGVSRRAIIRGIKELDQAPSVPGGRVRRPGGGRKRTVDKDASLKTDVERLVDPVTRGDPESPLRWTCKSVRKLAEELKRLGHQISHRMVAELLHELGYSLQANRKTLEGSSHADRDQQFQHINQHVMSPSFSISSSPSFQSIQRRKSWWAISRIMARNCAPKATRNQCACMTL